MLAIGSAKELVEATCRTALAAKGIAAPRSLDLPELVKQAQEALGIHPAGAGVDGTEVVRRLLGKLSGVANDLAHLRNGHGTGHAPTKADATLRARHGRLAVGAADVWCTFMLDTLQER